MKINYNQYIGQVFGNLIVQDISDTGHGARFIVKCTCGNQISIHAHKVINGFNKSCGCQKLSGIKSYTDKQQLQLIGKRFGRLIVENIDTFCYKKQSYWICKCDCGKIKSVRGSHLQLGRTISCGCINRGKTSKKWKGYEEISGKFFYSIKRNAITRNIGFNITIKDLWDLYLKQNKKCALSNLPLNFPSIVGSNDGTASLDRIDSSKSYILENSQWLHKDVNNLKWDFTQKEFINYCKIITENQKTQEINLESRIEYII